MKLPRYNLTVLLVLCFVFIISTGIATADTAFAETSKTIGDASSELENPGSYGDTNLSEGAQPSSYEYSAPYKNGTGNRPENKVCAGTDWDKTSTVSGPPIAPQSKIGTVIQGATTCDLVDDTLTCQIDTDPELDFYQPCGGGDNLIEFAITVSGIENLSVSQANLVLRQWDVDILGSTEYPECGPEVDRIEINGHSLGTLHGANQQWSMNTFVIDPEWIKEGDNIVRVFIDSTGSGCWCTMTDWGRLTLKVNPMPTIEKISITPDTPVTGKEITFTPTIKPADGWEVVGIQWILTSKNGDIIKTESTFYSSSTQVVDPFKYIPLAQADYYGDRVITAKLFCTNKNTGQTRQTHQKFRDFKIFFQMWRVPGSVPADDNYNNKPNWYEYWIHDGAVEGLSDTTYNWGRGYGSYNPSTNTLYVHPLAATTHYKNPIPIPLTRESFGGPSITGIDCAREVVVHEKQHQYHKLNLVGQDSDIWTLPNWTDIWPGGSHFYYTGAACPDGLPDTYESTKDTNITNPDTFNVAGVKGTTYRTYGDAELDCMREANGKKGVAANDWSDTGKNLAQPSSAAFQYSADNKVVHLSSMTGDMSGGIASFSNPTAVGMDTNGNGLYDLLRVTAQIETNSTDTYSILGIIRDGYGSEITNAFLMPDLQDGTNEISLDFDGSAIHTHGMNGPYDINISISDLEGERIFDQVDFQSPAFTISQFEGAQIQLSSIYSDIGVDTNGDGGYESLILNVGTNVISPGTYTLNAALYQSDTPLTSASKTVSLSSGNQNVELWFDGITIASNELNGPYNIRDVTITNSDGLVLDYAGTPYTTQAYQYTQFLPTGIAFEGAPTDQGVDTNLNGLYNLLTIDIGVNVTKSGVYTFTGTLIEGNGTVITYTTNTTFCIVGSQQVELEFDGRSIREQRFNGPYSLVQLIVYNDKGSVLAVKNDAYTTGPYFYTEFEGPTVYPTGIHSDQGVDSNGNGLYDTLQVQFDVTAENAGTYAINARLLDPNGNEVEYQEAFVDFNASQTQSILLPFDGKKCYATYQDGIYTLADLTMYDIYGYGQEYFTSSAFSTGTYQYTQFETTGIIYGTVSSVSGWPVRNADVYISGVSHDTTDSDGMYHLTVVTDGTYQVDVNPVAAHNLINTSTSVTVSGNSQVVNFTLLSNGAPSPSIINITPNSAKSGFVPFTINGINFVSDLTVQMTRSGYSNITAEVNNITPTAIQGTINLLTAANGSWNVVVINPDGQRGTITNGFRVTAVTNATASKIGVVRNNKTWILDISGNGAYGAGDITYTFGTAGDRYVTGDWTGTDMTKIGVVRNNKTWILDASGNGAFGVGDLIYNFGKAGDVYVSGDWTGTGTTRIGVVRNNKTWILDTSGNGAYGAGDLVYSFGTVGDVYITGDWNNDFKTEIGVVRNNKTWILDASGNGAYGVGDLTFTFGKAGDRYVTGDWNTDGKTEIGVVRSNTTWLLDASGNGKWGPGDLQYTFGKAGDRYVTGKWN